MNHETNPERWQPGEAYLRAKQRIASQCEDDHLVRLLYAVASEARMITLEPPRELTPDVDPWRARNLSRAGLTRFFRSAQAAVGMNAEVDVLLADDRTLRRLNRQFRGKDKATDVLSFPAAEPLASEHAGDLAVSLETARRQAEEHGHSLQEEVKVLLLHGLLHLDGMDHEADNGEMAAREANLRAKLRLPVGLIARASEAPEGRARDLNAKGAKGKREGRKGPARGPGAAKPGKVRAA